PDRQQPRPELRGVETRHPTRLRVYRTFSAVLGQRLDASAVSLGGGMSGRLGDTLRFLPRRGPGREAADTAPPGGEDRQREEEDGHGADRARDRTREKDQE